MESNIYRLMTRSMKLNEETKTKQHISKDGPKRSADHLPEIGNKKRILGDITNQVKVSNLKAAVTKKTVKTSQKEVENVANLPADTKVPVSEKEGKKSEKNEVSLNCDEILSNEDSEMYVTALDHSIRESFESEKKVPDGVEDYDASCLNDPYCEPKYAAAIFKYYIEREKLFPVRKYMSMQKEMTKSMRAILVDWMVEVQESFELNHETLYLAVKLVDRYLMKNVVTKCEIQLVGATALFLAAKYDERQPPLVDDFLYICDDSYKRNQLLETEIKMLKTIDFDLGIPLSYRFLRRYARCSRVSMELLTLARYILETALMDYELIDVRDSKMAAAALLLSLKMKNEEWTVCHEYYTGYHEKELMVLVLALNRNIAAPPNKHLKTIKTKYSHEVFFEVAKIPPLKI